MATPRLRIAIQKTGRLNDDCLALLRQCDIQFNLSNNALISKATNLPLDILFVRDDDIPTLVNNGICDLGIVGENVLLEQALAQENNSRSINWTILKKLGFCKCRLSIALPENMPFNDATALQNKKIATSYPNLLRQYLSRYQLTSEILYISGSVELAPNLQMADAICDLVSTGNTLKANNLKEVDEVMQSQAVLIASNKLYKTINLTIIDKFLGSTSC
jgi:ATP phosphoribosyltransferase